MSPGGMPTGEPPDATTARDAVDGPETAPGDTATPPTEGAGSSSAPGPVRSPEQAWPEPVEAHGGGTGALAYEDQHVHTVYDAIADHFSSTRYKPWPFVAGFLNSLPPGSVGLDVGCGNGKYLAVNPSIHLIGSDRSAALVSLARAGGAVEGGRRKGLPAGHDVVVADGLDLPFRLAAVDFAICIAVVHHFSTRERRVEAIGRLLECVDPERGRVLVYVWALEQGSSRRGWEDGGEQDLLVPWVMKGKGASPGTDAVYNRYYHLYRKGELEDDVVSARGRVLESGYEKDNWWVVCGRL